VLIPGLEGTIDLSVSGPNACAVLGDGTVRCWGRNSGAALLGFTSSDCGPYTQTASDGTTTQVSIPCETQPKKVPSAWDATMVSTGGEHACLRKGSGPVKCWGADQFGQLGDGLSGPSALSTQPVEVLGLYGAQLVSLGDAHSCAIAGPARKVRCWGDNSAGQLGIGTSALDSYATTPVDVVGLEGVVDLASAGHTTCAAKVDGTIACWGDTTTVLPPPGDGSTLSVSPTQLPGLGGAVEARTGGGHACARRADGSLVCWGSNDRGQLGNGTVSITDFSLAPVTETAPIEPPH
jgi:alpha-tubulin suppressor-like RCC1 family protein